MIKNIRLIFVFALFLMMFACEQAGYLHTQGDKIVDAKGNNIVLRGMGLGGWMIQEGYMMQSSKFAPTQWELKQTIAELVGEEGMNEFYDQWWSNYCTKADVDSMAAWGFNSIRLPMHYNLFTLPIEEEPVVGEDTWLPRGFEMVDSLLDWCADNEMYLILDLHAAPGGQGKNASINDYDESKPSLFESEENRRKMTALWAKLAKRYANEPWMGAYDILNEPNWDIDKAGNENGCDCNENEMLWQLYDDIIKAIRLVDKNHMVIIEGNCWGNNYKGLPNPNSFDDNLVISFHKYWNFNTQKEIQYILDMREQYNVPIWLGESGENSNTWFTNAIALVEANNIGWAWWPYKKISSVTGTVTIQKAEGYQKLLDYWSGKTEKPSVANANKWLLEQTQLMKLENCIIHYDVIDAMFRQAQGDKSTKAFANNVVPGIINATDYDLGAVGHAYFDTDTCNFRVSTQKSTGWNLGRKYRNDGVDIQLDSGDEGNGYHIAWTKQGEWLKYTVYATDKGEYNVQLGHRFGGEISIKQNEVFKIKIGLPNSDKWTRTAIGSMNLEQGKNEIIIEFETGGFELATIYFSKKGLKQ